MQINAHENIINYGLILIFKDLKFLNIYIEI
ncbi:MAG: hypothetical protein K0S33_681 [Bacteroidetes bacterium]|jgi:hypothetical protein|nr:hypothetical protein [Bacteroidota bacterium]